MGLSRILGTAVVSMGLCVASPTVAAREADRTTLLGLDGPVDSTAELDRLLQTALRRRVSEFDAGPPLTEIRLALNCSGNDPACLAQSGSMLDANEVVYGALVVVDGGTVLRLWRLDATGGVLLGSASTALPQPGDATLPALIDEMVGLLFGEPPPPSLPPAQPNPEGPAGPRPSTVAPSTDREQSDAAELVWGSYGPRPRWKIAGAGASGAVLLGGVVLWAVAGSRLRDGGPLRAELIDAAEASLEDDRPDNDLTLDAKDLCAAAQTVRNDQVLDVCRRTKSTRAMGFAGVAMTVVGLAATATFVTLLFVHKKKRADAARWRPTLTGTRRAIAAGVFGRF